MLAVLIASSCNPTRKLKANEYLLVENEIIDNTTTLDKEEIKSYIKQQPNRRILGLIRFHLGIYNLVDQKKMKARKIVHDKKMAAKNEKRRAKGKKDKDRLTWREWLLDIGEAPVLLDSTLMNKSARQIKLFLNNKGYFNSEVHDSVVVHRSNDSLVHGRKASVYYFIKAGKPYTIRNIKYKVEDDLLAYYVYNDTIARKIQPGQNYDVDNLQAERDRITSSLKNTGYYYFTREYVYFKADSNLNSRQIDITIGIKKFATLATEQGDSIVESNHKKYYVRNIYVQTDFNSVQPNEPSRDTTWYNASTHKSSKTRMEDHSYIFIHNGSLQYRPFVIADEITISKGELYQAENAEATYRRLADLRAFKLVSVRFRESGPDQLDCFIQLTPILKQAYTLQGEGTNTAGNLGIAGSFVYQNKNTLRGAEILEIKLKGALEAQKLINETDVNDNDNLTLFNTVEIGPEISLNVPRPLFPFNLRKYPKLATPKTVFTSYFNFQQRPEYSRSIYNLSYSFNRKHEPKKIFKGAVIRYSLFLPEISYVKVNPTANFAEALQNSSNLLLINQFTDHLTPVIRWVPVISNQRARKKNYYFIRFSAEESGNMLRWLGAGKDNPDPATGGYRISKVIYSQYLRADIDIRHYTDFTKHNKLVLRFAYGEGVPQKNLGVLPFERSFFAGGSNSIRAWRARSLGPGSFQSSFGESFDQIGDKQLEGNIEWRFNVIKMVNAALFVDAGNIWLRKADPRRPLAEFDLDRFHKEIAVGTGLGIRVDFNFFIIRLDAGLKLRDPKFGQEGRWVIRHVFDDKWKENYTDYFGHKYSFVNLNLGIGYPF
jgi:outer membrane translocation and assembly module TamA